MIKKRAFTPCPFDVTTVAMFLFIIWYEGVEIPTLA
jgi:hypothetical protein